MAKKIKFPLAMKNDVFVKDLNELRENFDLDKAVGYFLDGKLLRWLEARYYDSEAEAIKKLNSNAPDFKQQLCKIFDVDFSAVGNIDTDFDAVAEHNRKLTALKQYTSDPNILAKVDSVAFNQEDLSDLLDEGLHEIYLCDNSFAIPLRLENKRYIGVGKVEIVINSDSEVDFASKKIEFENVQFDSKYQSTLDVYKKGLEAENNEDYRVAYECYEASAKLGNNKAMAKIGKVYYKGLGTRKDYEKAFEWFKKAVDNGNADPYTYYAIGCSYQKGNGVAKNYVKALEWHKKAAEQDCAESMYNLGVMYSDSKYGILDYNVAYQWYDKSAELNYPPAMISMGILYMQGIMGVKADFDRSMNYFNRAYDLKEKRVMRIMGIFLCNQIVYHNGDDEAKEKLVKWIEHNMQTKDAGALMVLCNNTHKFSEALNLSKESEDKIFEQATKKLRKLGYVRIFHDPALQSIIDRISDPFIRMTINSAIVYKNSNRYCTILPLHCIFPDEKKISLFGYVIDIANWLDREQICK